MLYPKLRPGMVIKYNNNNFIAILRLDYNNLSVITLSLQGICTIFDNGWNLNYSDYNEMVSDDETHRTIIEILFKEVEDGYEV